MNGEGVPGAVLSSVPHSPVPTAPLQHPPQGPGHRPIWAGLGWEGKRPPGDTKQGPDLGPRRRPCIVLREARGSPEARGRGAGWAQMAGSTPGQTDGEGGVTQRMQSHQTGLHPGPRTQTAVTRQGGGGGGCLLHLPV